MASVQRIRHIANPRRGLRRPRDSKGHFIKTSRVHRRRNASARRPVLRRYSVKSLKTELKRRGAKTNPRSHRRFTKRRNNPVLIELGTLPLVNPRRRKNRVAAPKRKRVYRRRRNPRAVAPRRRRSYATHRVHHRRRRRMAVMHNPMHRRRRYRRHNPRRYMRHNRRHNRRYSYRRNPSLFGHRSAKDLLMMTGGVLVGVAATKYIPTILPSSITSLGGGSPWAGVLITGAGAFAAGWLARKFMGETFGDAVMLGGLAQVGSQILTILAPPSLTSALALSGMGDIIPGMFAVPQNPIKAGMQPPVALPVAKTPPSGVGAFRGAFGNRR